MKEQYCVDCLHSKTVLFHADAGARTRPQNHEWPAQLLCLKRGIEFGVGQGKACDDYAENEQ